jgi:acyl-coenzyme A thioesterase PaaI-like protein
MPGDPPPAPETPVPLESPARDPEVEAQIAEKIIAYVPHNRALGLRFLSSVRGCLTVVLPYDERLIGNPATRVIHGGAITALMDAMCGATVFLALGEPIPVATLDLRIDPP